MKGNGIPDRTLLSAPPIMENRTKHYLSLYAGGQQDLWPRNKRFRIDWQVEWNMRQSYQKPKLLTIDCYSIYNTKERMMNISRAKEQHIWICCQIS